MISAGILFSAFLILILIFLLFRATPVTYESFGARGQIRAIAAGLCLT